MNPELALQYKFMGLDLCAFERERIKILGNDRYQRIAFLEITERTESSANSLQS